jgi:hypothetical protein
MGSRLGLMTGMALGLLPQYNSTAGVEGVGPYLSASDPTLETLEYEVPDVVRRLFGVRFEVEMPFGNGPQAMERRGFVRSPSAFWVKEHPETPRAFLVSRVRTADTGPELAALLATPGFDPMQMAVIPGVRGERPLHSLTRQPPVEIRRPTAERMAIRTEASEPTLLVVSEHYDPGWEVTVDGQRSLALAADFLALGVRLSAGPHTVELRYWPEGFTRGLRIFALVLAGFAVAGVAGALRRRSKK